MLSPPAFGHRGWCPHDIHSPSLVTAVPSVSLPRRVEGRTRSYTASLVIGSLVSCVTDLQQKKRKRSRRFIQLRATSAVEVFARAWYPLGFTAVTDRGKPHHLRVCNVPVVFWHDGDAWRAAIDECPHRRVRLSEGRLEGSELQCPYHGWTFNGQGQCTRIPQADESSQKARLSPRACLSMLPTEERNGLLFLWAAGLYGDPEPPDHQALDELIHQEDIFAIPGVQYVDYSRDLFMDMPILLENVLDPAHLPFTHHATISSRKQAAEIPIQITSRDPGGFTGRRDKPQLQASGVVSYKAPNHVWSLTDRKDSYRDWNIVYAAPICPGRSRIFVRVVFEVPKVPMPLRQIFQVVFSPSLPPWVTHLLNHNVLEDDNVFLHYQGETMAPDGKQDAKWQERFYTPTSSDAAVLCYHRWLQDVGGGVHWARDPSTSIKRKGREELLERLHSHTDHCWSCSEALALSQMLQSWGRPLLLLALLTTVLLDDFQWPLAMLSIAVAAVVACAAALEKQLTVGEYPPPRNR
ncbi:unnamed protein product [Durusdinium trenchii]|uniref:Chloroplastic (AtPaO) (Pheide a oxygenase) (Accelerated cell death 1) (Lethal leaf-spot 1 homolog) (Lls1) n=2 Tax=Durusdinium trenchii TaxID=1381693 RepID=A0ABP0RCA2_9DINO